MKKKVLITGSAGLIGSESARFFAGQGFEILGIDNDMRARFFGADASTGHARAFLSRTVPGYRHLDFDIRERGLVDQLFAEHGRDFHAVIHAAAQPSHDWAAREPETDFGVNALATLHLLEAARQYAPEAVFIYASTNKVYGEHPNQLPFRASETRFDLPPDHPRVAGIDETMSIDQTRHSLFGVSKLSADLLVQEYGRYFGLPTVCFRCGCLTGPSHAGTEMHGFLAYLMKCVRTGKPYRVYGYEGRQVRDAIHSRDLVSAFWHFAQAPRPGEVYNIGGSRFSHCSMREAIALCEAIAERKLDWTYVEENRLGDHKWWVSDVRKFQAHYPGWKYEYALETTLRQIAAACG